MQDSLSPVKRRTQTNSIAG